MSNQKDDDDIGLRGILGKLSKIDKRIAAVIYIAMAIILVSSFSTKYNINSNDILYFSLVIAAIAIVILIARHFFGAISKIFAWFLALIAMVWVSVFIVQFLSSNEIAFLPKAGCILKPFRADCLYADEPLQTEENDKTIDPLKNNLLPRPKRFPSPEAPPRTDIADNPAKPNKLPKKPPNR